MSLARPLLRSGVSRTVGTVAASRASSSKAPAQQNASSSASPAAPVPEGQASLFHTILPSVDVPRSSKFPNPFPDMPTHSLFNVGRTIFKPLPLADRPKLMGANHRDEMQQRIADVTGRSTRDVSKLMRFPVIKGRVVNMTKKGKMASQYVLMVAGDPEKGLVGVGRGRHELAPVAGDTAFRRAVLAMDYVAKFENRTLFGHGADLKAKFGATTVIMRARPPGFGLQVPHVLHRLLSACGIRDASATIEGSRHPGNVLAAGLQILHGGFGPAGFGSGTGKPGRKQDKGAGMRTIRDIELERGRYGVDLGKRL